ncbi:thiol peroxidase [Endozoicomonas arenosclerae]|uniref:thiol peroxidase n=1 Tax=Endozoicomonas arenosclerae TaxID=1633495 RepID=UPI000784F91A|nr:thiol peroxidase [Endozoicomonas arenosclerae]
MSNVTFQGQPISLQGEFPQPGSKAPDFTLCGSNLVDVALSEYQGKKLILNIFPSIDTPVCAASVKAFNQAARDLENTVVLCVSADLPFAQTRYCSENDLNEVKTASFFRNSGFPTQYGVAIGEGALRALAARAVICIDEQGEVVYSELVSDITDEPDYQSALAASMQP